MASITLRRCLPLLLVLLSPTALALDNSDAFNLAGFRSLTGEKRIEFIVAHLDERDAALRNIDYVVLETYTNVAKADGTRRYIYKYINEFRRLDHRMWLHQQEYKSGDPNAGIREESVQNWDGDVSRRLTLPPYTGAPYPIGQIQPLIPNTFIYHRFLAIAGLRLKVTNEQFPLTQWLRDAVRKGAKIDATDVVRNGTPCLKLTVDRLPPAVEWRRELWLDPARGFMPVQFDQVYGKRSMEWLMEVQEAEERGGTWVPKRAIGHNTTNNSKEVGETVFEVQEFRLGSVKEHDLDVVLPKGTFVVDSVHFIAYNMLQDGTYELKDLADTEKHVLHVAPRVNITDHIDESTAKSYKTVPLD